MFSVRSQREYQQFKQKRTGSGKKILAKAICTTIEMENFSFDLRKVICEFSLNLTIGFGRQKML